MGIATKPYTNNKIRFNRIKNGPDITEIRAKLTTLSKTMYTIVTINREGKYPIFTGETANPDIKKYARNTNPIISKIDAARKLDRVSA